MQNTTLRGEYTFLPLGHVIFGAGSVNELAKEVTRIGGTRVLVITGNSLATQTDVVRRVTDVLGELHVGTFHEIRQHAPKSGVAQAAAMARSVGADMLVSVGGGSPIDAAKAVALTLAQEGGSFLPHIAIPTTLSAAEYAHTAGVTDEAANAKTGVADVQITPRSIILDSELTLATPMPLWLSTGIRSLDHAVETLYAPGAHPINDVLALEAVKKLFTYLPLSQAEPDNLEVRTELQLASWMSYFAPLNTQMGLSHNLGRRMGATYRVPHGVTSCITLPVVMHAKVTENASQLAPLARVLQLPVSGDDPVQAAHAAADAVFNLIHGLGLPQHLREVGIGEGDIRHIAVSTVGEGAQLPLVENLLRQML
jgi:maleylacetate reductase